VTKRSERERTRDNAIDHMLLAFLDALGGPAVVMERTSNVARIHYPSHERRDG
jgi:hypothetical protein